MVDWRTLGEVPDSEDEDGFDSQSTEDPLATEPAMQTTLDSHKATHKPSSKGDIWDIPSSPEAEDSRSRTDSAEAATQNNRHGRKPMEDADDMKIGGVSPSRTDKHAPSGPSIEAVGDTEAAPLLAEEQTEQGYHEGSNAKDIWDIPSTEEEEEERRPPNDRQQSEAGSPSLSQAPKQTTPLGSHFASSQDLPPIEQLFGRDPEHGRKRIQPPQESNATVTINSPSPSNNGPTITTPAPPLAAVQDTQAPLYSQILGHDTEQEEASLAPARYERSFRTRKPEQLHPYEWEMARFRQSWTKSGMRPMRIADTEQPSPRQERADSEEADFEPESQGSEPLAQESQVRASGDIMEGLMITGPSSSPLQTSPLDNKGGPSSQMSSQAGTGNSSLDDDDLPSLQQLAKSRLPRHSTKERTKRQPSPSRSSVRKRRRVPNPFDSSPVRAPSGLVMPRESPDPAGHPDSPRPLNTPDVIVAQGLANGTPVAGRSTTLGVADRFALDNSAELAPPVHVISDDGSGISSESSDSDSELVDKNRGRIRGVLPASWLRIDQQSGTQLKKLQGPLDHSPARESRRGVAQRRQTAPGTAPDKFWSSESEDEAPSATHQPTTDEVFQIQTRLTLQPLSNPPAIEQDSDDGASVVEENYIDRMASGRKRQTKFSDAFNKTAKQPKAGQRSALDGAKRDTQPKISNAFGKPNGRPTGITKSTKKRTKKRKQGGSTRARSTTRPRPAALHLSVLDVIEPDAPQFLRIAARTAKSRQNQGRASPTKKKIQLATRQDHLDAVAVLGDWRRGSIKQRESVTATRRSRQSQQGQQAQVHTPATQLDVAPRPTVPTTAPRKLTKQLSSGGHIRYKGPDARAGNTLQPSKIPSEARFQPAQLQTEDPRVNAASFQVGKKWLDGLYQRRRGTPTAASTVPETVRALRIRRRKQKKPQHIDVGEAQYSRANDPIASVQSTCVEPELVVQNTAGPKLLGLGPYGTLYTNHFEVFPLTPGIYFHDSTLLGGGVLEAVLHLDFNHKDQESRTRAVLRLGEQTLRWGPWNAQISSEIGVVFDYVGEQLEKPSENNDFNTPTSTAAAEHLLSYARSSITFESDSDVKAFLARCLEVVRSFVNRLPTCQEQAPVDTLQVCDRVGLFSFIALRMCRKDPNLEGYQMQLEDLLKSLLMATARLLMVLGSDQLKQTYDRLKNARTRERGLRIDDQVIHSWTLMLRILESASIPRASFWDVVQPATLPVDLASCIQAGPQEQAWKDFFCLLPLTDFTDSGVIVAGGRQRAATDGWSIPQKLLKRVFQIYQNSSGQSPGFNGYCRALLGRCHYLIEQWTWRKSSGVVGTIFDFFSGSQSLKHMRNEESYDSPRFLEDLHRAPSLKVEAEDRCFHIFLKMLALSIKMLRQDGAIKEIDNLVTRTVPNHSRQYSKEQTIHERDLAALRNHHDLLVTLYWAAPPDLRPKVARLEGLVIPASSHKEACLINLRAWNQLARFVISNGIRDDNGEVQTSFGLFGKWRDTFFQQMTHGLDSVASDIQQQLANLSTDVRKTISADMTDAMAKMNKVGIMDVLHLSMTASLDVMKQAPDLEAACYALSTVQLQRVFTSFTVSPPEMDWGILRSALATVDIFLSRIDEFQEAQESQQSESQILNMEVGDDALLVFNEHVAGSYFKMARYVIASAAVKDANISSAMDRFDCTEHAVRLAARIAVKFINADVMTVADLFKPGKYRLFGRGLPDLGLEQRKFLCLFVLTMLKHGLGDFHNTDVSLQQLYMLSIVKPQESLAYENRLAEQLALHEKAYVPKTVVGLVRSPDYGSNRQLFEFAIDDMRKSVRDAGSRKDLIAEHAKTLGLVMAQMQSDLKAIVDDRSHHPAYVTFVRSIISLIKSHGHSICKVDIFFFQFNKEYQPPRQDPQHQVATMASYGLRILEGNEGAESQLFWFLLGCFKSAVTDNRLDREARLLAEGLRKPGILGYMLERLLPAIVEAMMYDDDLAFPAAQVLLNVCCQATDLMLNDEEQPFDLEEEHLPHIQSTLTSIARMLHHLRLLEDPSVVFLHEEWHCLSQLFGLMNLLWPSIFMHLIRGRSSHALEQIKSLLEWIRQSTAQAEVSLGKALIVNYPLIDVFGVLGGVSEAGVISAGRSASVLGDFLVNDIRRNWNIDAGTGRIIIQTVNRPTQSTQTAQAGVLRSSPDARVILEEIYGRVREWNRWWNKSFGTTKAITAQEILLF